MRQPILNFTVERVKPRNKIAEAMYDRDGPYRPRTSKKENAYKRRDKHRNRPTDY